jgi:hypothetical protein
MVPTGVRGEIFAILLEWSFCCGAQGGQNNRCEDVDNYTVVEHHGEQTPSGFAALNEPRPVLMGISSMARHSRNGQK